MPTTSTKRGLRTPLAVGETPNVPRDIGFLVADLEAEVGYLAERGVLDVGMVGQTRAGHILTPADFTDLGLSAPTGLWLATSAVNQINDQSGNARHLTNKGAVPFGIGIDGAASSAAIFAGSTAQALYRADTGAADPFRIKTGAVWGWFRTAKRGTDQVIIGKSRFTAVASIGWQMYVNTSNGVTWTASADGTTNAFSVNGASDVCDDRWHFAFATFDGATARLYIDGVLEAATAFLGTIFPSTAPLNIGGREADGAIATAVPFFGRIDEAGVTADVPSEDQIRLLYAIKLPHGAPRSPRRSGLTVKRRRRGAMLVAGDFPSQPTRLYNLAPNGDLSDISGSGGPVLTLPTGGWGGDVAGPDGKALGAMFSGGGSQGMASSDAGLPAGLATRSFGIWFKTTYSGATQRLISWGSLNADASLQMNTGAASGYLYGMTGTGNTGNPPGRYDDGLWHHAVVVQDNAAADGLRNKLYVDGRLASADTILNTLTLGGANRFRIGANFDGTNPFTGQLARAFASGIALTPDQIMALYLKGNQDLGRSPKNAGDHIERIDATNVYFIGDTLDPQDRIELEVAA